MKLVDSQATTSYLQFDTIIVTLTVDGIFGDKTKAGVIAFQTAAGVKVDGIVGPVTQGALTAALADGSDKTE